MQHKLGTHKAEVFRSFDTTVDFGLSLIRMLPRILDSVKSLHTLDKRDLRVVSLPASRPRPA